MEAFLLFRSKIIFNFLNQLQGYAKWGVLLLLFFISGPAFAGPGQCDTHCFTTQVLSVNEADACKEYTLKVVHDGTCRYALSHFTVGIPCGEVVSASNSENWPMELNMTDPTTGIYGFKVDEIEGFGEEDVPQEFTVKFTLCPDHAPCENELKCWAPVVAYKAGQCVNIDTLEVNCNTLNGSIIPSPESCYGANDGGAEVVLEGGVESFSFIWSNGSTTQNLTGVGAGEYSVTITDANGQEIILNTTVDGPEAIEISGTITGSNCSGVNNGSIALSVSGGISPYSYSWSNGESTANIDNLSPGFYNVTVTDAKGCTASAAYEIETSNAISAKATGSVIACGENNTGTVNLTVNGGTAPYSYQWSNGAVTEDLESVNAGFYFVTVTDANGCSLTTSASVTKEQLSLTASVTRTTCHGSKDGAIDVSITSGVAPYTYSWSSGQTTEDLSGLPRGVYTLEVTDAQGCTGTKSYFVSEPAGISGTISLQDYQCGEGSTATLDLYVSGGIKPYAYEWSTGETTEDITVGAEGTYQVLIIDANGCNATKEFIFEIPDQPLQLSYEKTDLNCNGTASGAIDLTVTGGKSSYSYRWSNGARTEDLNNLSGGTYSVTVTDAYGCSVYATIVIEEPVAMGCSIVNSQESIVSGSSGNMLSTSVEGAENYWWQGDNEDWVITNGQGTSEITYIAGDNTTSSATFTLTVTYDNGCSETCSIDLISNSVDGNTDPNDGDDGNTDPDDGDTNPDDGDTDPDDGNTDPDDGDTDPDDGNTNPDDGDTDPDDDVTDPDDGNTDPDDNDTDPDDGNTDSDDGDTDPDDGNTDPDDGNTDSDDGDTDPDENTDPDDEDGNDQTSDNSTCVDCFETNIISSSTIEQCQVYTMEISSDGSCSYDLSHFTVAIPCGKVSEVSNSKGWPIEYGHDPTTGLYGFKVDDVPGFGKNGPGESFTVTFTLCPEDEDCENNLACWEPVVAYKAGQCIFYDNLETTCEKTSAAFVAGTEAISASAFPNPFTLETTIEFMLMEDSYVTVELYSIYGNKVATLFTSQAEKGITYKINVEDPHLSEDTYIYRIISSKGSYTGKILRH